MSTPFHPFFTHFPIALLIVGIAFELLWLLQKQELFREMSFWMLLGGAAGAGLAVISGGWEEDRLQLSTTAHAAVESHETVGYITVWLIATLFVWKLLRRNTMSASENKVFIGAYSVAVIVMLYGGWLGGKLVYNHGVGVNIEEIKTENLRSEPVPHLKP